MTIKQREQRVGVLFQVVSVGTVKALKPVYGSFVVLNREGPNDISTQVRPKVGNTAYYDRGKSKSLQTVRHCVRF